MKPNFDKAEKTARLLRLSQPSSDLPLDVTKMVFDFPIIIDTFQNYSEITRIPLPLLFPSPILKDGYLIKTSSCFIILYDAEMPCGKRHTNWTLAHEIGHIYLGHEKDNAIEEVEALWFAAELLAPEIIIRAIAKERGKKGRKIDVYDIEDLFNISESASSKRVHSLNRKMAWLTYLEEETINKYKSQIIQFGL